MKKLFTIHRYLPAVLAVILIWGVLASARMESIIQVGKFSAQKPDGNLPSGWKTLVLNEKNKPTLYRLVKNDNAVVIRAEANAAASGIYREIRIDPAKYPIMRWRWKVNYILKKSDMHRKAGDDYPARIYVDFESNLGPGFLGNASPIQRLFSNGTIISYLWESKEPIGTIAPAWFSRQVMMIVVESGAEKLRRWVTEERNVYQDYKKAFGREPPMISGVAIVTETDDTGESAVSYYGDITFAMKEKK